MIPALLLVMSVVPGQCPQYCTEYSLRMVATCAREAREKNGKDDEGFMKDFTKCLDKAKTDYLYKRCQKVCKKGSDEQQSSD